MPVTSREGEPFSWSKDAQAHPWIAKCHRTEIGCFFNVSAVTEEEGQVKLALHNCPHRGGPTKIGLMVSVTLLEQVWALLDECVDKIMEPDLPADEKNDLQQQAKAYAKVICVFMEIYFPFPNEVSAEAKRRYQARVAGDTTYTTRGLGSRATEFPEGFRSSDPKPASKPTRNARAQKVAAPPKQLTDDEKKAVRFAASSGLFTHKQLAETYGVTERYIEQVVAVSA